jgi:2'-5' RNA ligase
MTERLFYGIPIPADVAGSIADVISRVPTISERAGPSANWHVTLRFLGATDGATRQAITRLVDSAPLPPAFQTRITTWGAFPRPATAKIFWIGLDDPDGRLSTLAAALESAARRVGFAPENRPFRPHVTLARFREPRNLRGTIEKLPAIDASIFIDRFVLFRSHLGSGPPRYEPVAVHELKR